MDVFPYQTLFSSDNFNLLDTSTSSIHQEITVMLYGYSMLTKKLCCYVYSQTSHKNTVMATYANKNFIDKRAYNDNHHD